MKTFLPALFYREAFIVQPTLALPYVGCYVPDVGPAVLGKTPSAQCLGICQVRRQIRTESRSELELSGCPCLSRASKECSAPPGLPTPQPVLLLLPAHDPSQSFLRALPQWQGEACAAGTGGLEWEEQKWSVGRQAGEGRAHRQMAEVVCRCRPWQMSPCRVSQHWP